MWPHLNTLLQFEHFGNIVNSHAQDKVDLQVLQMVMMSETRHRMFPGTWRHVLIRLSYSIQAESEQTEF